MENPVVWWREWWRALNTTERTVVIVTFVMVVFVLIVLVVTPALAAAVDGSNVDNIWTVLIISVVTGTLSPALLLWMTNRNKRQERLEIEAREDAREARAAEAQRLTLAGIDLIKKQTDGVISQVTALAKATGHIEGGVEATRKAENTAATLALGQQQGRDAERESKAATAILTEQSTPLPVVDKITNETGERAAQALESMANTAAKSAEEKKT